MVKKEALIITILLLSAILIIIGVSLFSISSKDLFDLKIIARGSTFDANTKTGDSWLCAELPSPVFQEYGGYMHRFLIDVKTGYLATTGGDPDRAYFNYGKTYQYTVLETTCTSNLQKLFGEITVDEEGGKGLKGFGLTSGVYDGRYLYVLGPRCTDSVGSFQTYTMKSIRVCYSTISNEDAKLHYCQEFNDCGSTITQEATTSTVNESTTQETTTTTTSNPVTSTNDLNTNTINQGPTTTPDVSVEEGLIKVSNNNLLALIILVVAFVASIIIIVKTKKKK